MKKKLLVYAHYFYPDVASTGQILTELCEELQNDFEITVICVVPSYDGKVDETYNKHIIYKEVYKNINVVRLRISRFDKKNKLSRLRNILSYFFKAIIATYKVDKQDIVFSISQPPILGGLLGTIGKWIKKAKYIYNIQDFNPEQTEVVRYAKNKLILYFCKVLDKFSCRQADIVVLVGDDMQVTLSKRFKNKNIPNSIVINNWIDETQVYPLPQNHPKVTEFKEKYELVGKKVFMYSGNLGLYYDLENLIKVIGEFRNNNNIVFAFVGDGSIKYRLFDYVNKEKIENIKFIPYQNKEDLIYSLNAADVHIVCNARNIKGISVPSKIYGILAAGKYVLGILEDGSEAANIIHRSGCGVVIKPENYTEIKKQFEYIISADSEKLMKIGMRGRQYLEKNLCKRNAIQKYKNIL